MLIDFNAVIPEGGTVCLMGPSGCGKTTLLNILMGLIKADSGTVEGVPRKKSAVFQEDRLCEDFTAPDNIRLATGKHVPDEEIIKHLKLLGLEGSLGIPVREFSGGMKRRTAICRAVLAMGDVIFLDEAFKGLDAETKIKTVEYIKTYTANKTIIAVTHDEEEARLLNGKIIKMDISA